MSYSSCTIHEFELGAVARLCRRKISVATRYITNVHHQGGHAPEAVQDVVRRRRSLGALFAENADADVRGLDHRDVVRSIAYSDNE